MSIRVGGDQQQNQHAHQRTARVSIRVGGDQQQNQHARQRTARVSIRVGGDQQQNQHARRRTARVSIRVENSYCIIHNDNASDWFENYCSILQQVVISI